MGMPPANISPNPGTAIGGGEDIELSAGAPTEGGPDSTDTFRSNRGFDLSTVTAFFRRVPLRISPKRASRPGGGRETGIPPGGGGGGGGGGGAGIAIGISKLSYIWLDGVLKEVVGLEFNDKPIGATKSLREITYLF